MLLTDHASSKIQNIQNFTYPVDIWRWRVAENAGTSILER